MLRLGMRMLIADRARYLALLFGIAFTAFLVSFAASYFCGFMTRSFALIAENFAADVWVMDPAVMTPEQTVNMPGAVLNRIRSVDGVSYATPMMLGSSTVRFANGRIQTFQIIGVDNTTLAGTPPLQGNLSPSVLHRPDAAVAAAGGTEGKLETPTQSTDLWPTDGPHLDIPTRQLAAGDEVVANGHRVKIEGVASALPRFPPRPLLYMTFANASRVLPPERRILTFVLTKAKPGIDARMLAARIEVTTGLRARTAQDFRSDTVWWFLMNSEDVGDVASMLVLAMTVGFGVAGAMLYMFTHASLGQYAVLKAMGATSRTLISIVCVQAGFSALVGTGLGLGMCAVTGHLAASQGYPFRMMWFTPLVGAAAVLVVSLAAALISFRPVVKLQPANVFSAN
ncbi:MAG: ABC transporter permease [Rhizobiales bacterium]|nr:ABC transporter permease [Hyphomicrobiales bacterium]